MIFDKEIALMVGKYSLLTSIQQSIMTFGMVCVQGIVNTFGPDTIAAFTAAGKIDSIAYLPVQDFGNAFSTYIVQNKGAQNKSRILEGIKSASRTIILFCAVTSTIIFISSGSLMKISLALTIISLGTRVVMAYVLSGFPGIGQKGIWWSIPLGWALADITGFIIYKKIKEEGLC